MDGGQRPVTAGRNRHLAVGAALALPTALALALLLALAIAALPVFAGRVPRGRLLLLSRLRGTQLLLVQNVVEHRLHTHTHTHIE